MKVSKLLQWISGGLELFLGIPLLGGTIVISFLYTPLALMLVLHIVTLYFIVQESREKSDRTGSIVGIVTSCIAWIPFVGMTMHIITGVLLLINAAKNQPSSGDTVG